jgi:WD40 repeat protein
VWDTATGKHRLTRTEQHFFSRRPISALAWSSDCQRIASADHDRVIRVWDASTGKIDLMYVEHTSPVSALAWSPDGLYIASLSGKDDDPIRIWSPIRTGKEQIIARSISTYYDHVGSDQWAELVTWSPDSKWIASAGGGTRSVIHIWDLSLKNAFIYRKHHTSVHALAWSPDGTCIASSDDKTVHIWRAG